MGNLDGTKNSFFCNHVIAHGVHSGQGFAHNVSQLPHADIAVFLPRGAALAKVIEVAFPKAKFCCRIAKLSQ